MFGLVAALVCCGGAHAATSCVRAEPACLQRLPLSPGLCGAMYATRPVASRFPWLAWITTGCPIRTSAKALW